jgi:hypothetical protein
VSVALVMQHAKPRAVICCYMWPARGHHTSSHYLIKGKISGKILWNIKYVCSPKFLSETFLILRRILRYIYIYIYIYIDLQAKHPLFFCQILNKPEFFREIFVKYSNTKFHENPPSGSRAVPCGRMEGQADMPKLIIAFPILRMRLKKKYTYTFHL